MPADPETVFIVSLRGLVTRLAHLESQAVACSAKDSKLSECAQHLAAARESVIGALRLLNRQQYP
ncbi:MAG: hypothetical protein H0W13_10135 [Nitrospirales bacterium]|nr:hypothetical protein [Nitrospirales bacterium]